MTKRRVRRIRNTGLMRVLRLEVGGYDHNFSYVLMDGGEAALIDPTGSWEMIRRTLVSEGASHIRYILITHGHVDHFGALDAVERTFPDAEICGHPENPAARRKLADGEVLPLGGTSIETLFTPGHSRDSVCYLCGGTALFTGDTLFVDCVGFARKPESMYSSLNRIAGLSGDITIYPGHDYGRVPCRTLAEEKRENQYLNCRTLEAFKIQLKELV